jgi:hypothetical protein
MRPVVPAEEKEGITMTKRVQGAFGSFAVGITVLLLGGLTLCAQDNFSPKPTIRRATTRGISPPLRELAKLPGRPQYRFQASGLALQSQRRPAGAVVDAVEQSTGGTGSSFSIGISGLGLGSGFTGFSTNFNYPDDNIAVGKDQIVQVVNNSVIVFDKSLNPLVDPVPISQLLSAIGGICAEGTPEGHPIAQYDRMSGQWLIAENVSETPGTYSSVACIGVSTSSDATSSYYVYEFPLSAGYMDLPKWASFPTGFFQSNDNFGADGHTFQGAYECAYDRVTMEMGGDAGQVCFQLTTSDFALLPADLDSSAPPPANQDEFLFSLLDSSDLALYSFHTDWTDPTKAFMTGSGESQPFPVPSFTPACNGQYLGACVPQLSTPTLLNVLGDRLLYRVAYYDDVPVKVPVTALPPHYQHWLVMHDATASGGNTAERWYEFYSSTKTTQVTNIKLLQSGTYAPDSNNYRWMGSFARDQNGDILMGYSESSASTYPSIYITGRTLADPSGTMEAELQVIAGDGAYLGIFDRNLDRWGDYTSMRLDPADNCTFWYTNEYYMRSGIFNWSTQINSACFNGCGGCGARK